MMTRNHKFRVSADKLDAKIEQQKEMLEKAGQNEKESKKRIDMYDIGRGLTLMNVIEK